MWSLSGFTWSASCPFTSRTLSLSAAALKKGVKIPVPRIFPQPYATPSNPTLVKLEGVTQHPLKYHYFWPKKPSQPYGLQGSTHLLPEKGRVAKRFPFKMMLEKDRTYAWCTCGYSRMQPLCDGAHEFEKTTLRPVRFIPEKDMEVWFCQCKQTRTRPFCDGSHKLLDVVADADVAATTVAASPEAPLKK